jgi:acetyl esterase/lipase
MEFALLAIMKKYMLPMMMLFFSVGCNSAEKDPKPVEILPAKELRNVAYGDAPQQKMDIYLPKGRNQGTKVFILVHGGGWSGGSKADFDYVIPMLKSKFPNYAIVNMNYQLATMESPAFPKQIQDIEKAVQHLKNSDYNISSQYAFIGASAGAHLAMLYSYRYDTAHNVKAVCNIVGPADFTDPFYATHPYFHFAAMYLVGDITQRPDVANEVSPALQVTAQSPPTIMFYGGQDPVVPQSQAIRLKAKLDEYKVYNEYYLYAGGGHGNWNKQTMSDFEAKLIAFLKERF